MCILDHRKVVFQVRRRDHRSNTTNTSGERNVSWIRRTWQALSSGEEGVEGGGQRSERKGREAASVVSSFQKCDCEREEVR